MHSSIFFCIAILWQGGYSIGCNCGLGPGVSQCLAGGGIGSIIGGGGSIITGGGSIIDSATGSIISSSGGSIIGGSGSSIRGGGISGAGSYPQIIRPQQLAPVEVGTYTRPRVVCKTIGGGVKPLSPIGDLCSGSKTIVKPAIIPRPGCSSCSTSHSSSSNSAQTIRNTINQAYLSRGGVDADSSDGASPLGSISSGPYGNLGADSSLGSLGAHSTYTGQSVLTGAGTYASTYTGQSHLTGAGTYSNIYTGQSDLTGAGTYSGGDILSHLNIGYRQCGLPVLPKQNNQDKLSRYAEADAFSLQEYFNQKNKLKAQSYDSAISEGFKKKPQQRPCASKQKQAAFPEQQLYALNGEVLEPPTFSESTGETIDEEALRLLEEQEAEQEAAQEDAVNSAPSVRLDDIGYRPYKGTDNEFVTLENSGNSGVQSACGSDDLTIDADGLINSDGVEADVISGPGGTIGLVSHCRDGYKSGQVVIQHGPVSSQVVLPRPPTPACLPGEQQTGSGSLLTYSQSHSLSSSTNNEHSSYNIGCS